MTPPTSNVPPTEPSTPLGAAALTEDLAVNALRRTWQPVANAVDLPPRQNHWLHVARNRIGGLAFRRRSIAGGGYRVPAQGREVDRGLHPGWRARVPVSWLEIQRGG